MKYLSRFLVIMAISAFFIACNDESSVVAPESPQSADEETDGFFHPKFPFNLEAEYEIEIENITPATAEGASQPFSPPVIASHSPFFHVYRVGKYASSELAQVAEDAVSGPLVDLLSNTRRVHDVQMGDGVILPGKSTKIMISAKPGFHKLSLVAMLVNTNDAFVGVDGIRLPFRGSKTYRLRAYDAGSEENTELHAHIPGPCCGNPLERVPTTERIKRHRGILGHGDLDPQVYGWKGRVARLTITRIN